MLPTLDFVSPVHFVMVITNLGSGGGGRPYGCRRRRGSRATYMAATIASTGARAAISVSVSSAITVIFPSGSDAEQPQRDGDGKHHADGLSEHPDLQPVENPADWSHAGRRISTSAAGNASTTPNEHAERGHGHTGQRSRLALALSADDAA